MEMQNQNTPIEKRPDNYLVWSILSTVLCCLPLGIVSIVYSTKVDRLWDDGDKAGSRDAADKAKKFAIISAVSAAVVWIIYIILIAAGVVAGFGL